VPYELIIIVRTVRIDEKLGIEYTKSTDDIYEYFHLIEQNFDTIEPEILLLYFVPVRQ